MSFMKTFFSNKKTVAQGVTTRPDEIGNAFGIAGKIFGLGLVALLVKDGDGLAPATLVGFQSLAGMSYVLGAMTQGMSHDIMNIMRTTSDSKFGGQILKSLNPFRL